MLSSGLSPIGGVLSEPSCLNSSWSTDVHSTRDSVTDRESSDPLLGRLESLVQRARSFRKGREGVSDVSNPAPTDANVDVERLEQLLLNARQFRMARASAATDSSRTDASLTSASPASDFVRANALEYAREYDYQPRVVPLSVGPAAEHVARAVTAEPHDDVHATGTVSEGMAPVLAELRSLLDTLNLFAVDERGSGGRGDGVYVSAAHRSGLRSSLGFGVDDGATNKQTEGAHAPSSALSRSAQSVASKSAGDGATAVARERRHRLHEQPSGVHAQAAAGAVAERTAEARAAMRTESARLICDDQWRTRYQAWLEGTLEHHRYQRHRDASASAVIDTLPLVRRDGDDSAKCAYGTSQWRGFGDSGRDREAALAAELIEWCDRIDHRLEGTRRSASGAQQSRTTEQNLKLARMVSSIECTRPISHNDALLKFARSKWGGGSYY